MRGCHGRCLANDSIFTILNTTAGNHFITGGTAIYTPFTPLTVRFSAGYDYNAATVTDITPFGHLRVPLGTMSQTLWNRTLITSDLAATYTKSLGRSISTSTSVGGQIFDSRLSATDLSSTNFAAPGEPVLTSGALRNISNVNQQRVINAGWFAQEVVGWRDILFLTGGVRVDGNSAFGSGFGLQSYPKISASYVLSDESFWPLRWMETFKLRAALGESGKAPGAFDAVRTWDPVAAENGQSASRPHRSAIRTSVPNARGKRRADSMPACSVVVCHCRIRCTPPVPMGAGAGDAPTVRGFSARQLENIGVLNNRGHELSVTAQLVRRRSVEFEVGMQYTAVKSEAGDLGGQTITVDANSLSFVQQGLPAPSYIGNRITNPDEFADPIVEQNVFLGGTFPDKIFSPRAGIRLWNRVSVDVIGEFQRGGHLLNSIGFANEGLFAWQPCYETQDKLRQAAAGNPSALNDVTARERGRCAIAAASRDAGFWVEKSDFFKLRSLSISVDLPDRLLGSSKAGTLTFSGRNLYRSTKYTGTDPESADQGVNAFSRRDYYIFPQPRTFLITLHTSF